MTDKTNSNVRKRLSRIDRYCELAARLCDYMGLKFSRCSDGKTIEIVYPCRFPDHQTDTMIYRKMRPCQFILKVDTGDPYSCSYAEYLNSNFLSTSDPPHLSRCILKNPLFKYSSLDELDLQLSIRGF